MILKTITLQEFRSYSRASFSFSNLVSLIIGPNTAGKTNIIESIYLLATGKSFRAERDAELIRFGENAGKITGEFYDDAIKLELAIIKNNLHESAIKKYFVNGVSKRKSEFSSHLSVVLFSPEDVEIISNSPGKRRAFLDEVLVQVDIDYSNALLTFSKALRQRNALLEQARDYGKNLTKQFEYWNAILIENGNLITNKREEFIAFLNTTLKEIFDFNVVYDKSTISKERLLQYEKAELGAGVTLVGPHRDDILFEMFHNETQSVQEVKKYGSRGQARLVIFQLKLLQIAYMEEKTKRIPLLLLDDIFSELDKRNIERILDLTLSHQAIITTTHKEFIPEELLERTTVIELKNN